jgi:hypothetical protein
MNGSAARRAKTAGDARRASPFPLSKWLNRPLEMIRGKSGSDNDHWMMEVYHALIAFLSGLEGPALSDIA